VAKKSQTTVFLIGDAELVAEFGTVCHNAGFAVSCKLNTSIAKKNLPSFVKVSTSIPSSVEFSFELTNSDTAVKKKNLQFLEKHSIPKCTLLTSSVIVTTLEQATCLKKPQRLIGMSAFPTLLSQKLIELSPTIHTEQSFVNHATTFFQKLGKETAIVQDRIGMVMPRILCMLINEAAFALTENIASPQDIDTAMKLGTNYPFGPIEWGDRIGFHHVVNVLNAIYNDTHEERYRTAPLLKQLATGTKWWGT